MIDWKAKLETSDGTPCRWLGTYKQCAMLWHIVAVDIGHGDEAPWTVTDEGRKCLHGQVSVRNVPEKHERWLNFNGKQFSGAWSSREIADANASTCRTACIRVEWQDGEGLT